MIRQFASTVARVATRSGKSVVARTATRSFSNFDRKERGDEARYFAEQDKLQLAEMKAKVEAIMASQNHSDKEELLDLLGK